MKILSGNWQTVKKYAADFVLTFIALFNYRNDDFSCREKGEDEHVVFYRWLLVGAVLLGAVLRIFLLYQEPQLCRDAVYYLNMAEIWSKSRFTSLVEYDPAFYIPPVMLGIIQLFIRLGCSPIVAGITLNLFAGIILIPIFYFIGKCIFDSRKAGVIAAFLTSFNPVLADYSKDVMRENFMLLFLALALLGVILGFRKKDIWFLAGGFFTAWASLSRYEALEFLPLLALTFVFFAVCKVFSWKKIFICGLWFCVGMIIGIVSVVSLFGIPISFFTEPFYAKIVKTLL